MLLNLETGLHDYIDALQIELGNVHEEIVKTWFAFDHSSLRLPRAAG